MKIIYIYTVDTVKYINGEVINKSPIPFASKTEYNSGKTTSCLGFCHLNLKRLIPLNNDYSLKNDYYTIGLTNSKTLGPNGGVFIYYIMKIEDIITYATAYERFPEWRADNYRTPEERPIPIRPIVENEPLKDIKSRMLYIIDENDEVIYSFPYKHTKEDRKSTHNEIKTKITEKTKIYLRIDAYDYEFIKNERKLEAKNFINQEENNFSIIYEYIPNSHHNEVDIAFKDVRVRKASYPSDIKVTPIKRRNGDRLFVSYSNFKFFRKTLSSENGFYQSHFEINEEIMKIIRKNIIKYVNTPYMESVKEKTPRGKEPRRANINPLIITGEDASELLELITPEFN